MDRLIKLLMRTHTIKSLCDILDSSNITIPFSQLSFSMIISSVLKRVYDKKLIVVESNELKAKKAYQEYSQIFKEKVLYYHPKDYVLHPIDVKSHDIEFERIKMLSQLAKGDYDVIVTVAYGLMDYIDNPNSLIEDTIVMEIGDEINLEDIISKLHFLGYKREQIVEGKGQFSIRGGILDVFPINLDHPIRLEFFGDEIDGIRVFDEISQRSISNETDVSIMPAKEKRYNEKAKENLYNRIHDFAKDKSNILKESIESDIYRLIDGGELRAQDKYTCFISEEKNLLDYVEDSILILDDKKSLVSAMELHDKELADQLEMLLEKERIDPLMTSILMDTIDVQNSMERFKQITFSTVDYLDSDAIFKSKVESIPSYSRDIERLINDIKKWLSNKNTVVFVVSKRSDIDRVLEMFHSYGLNAFEINDQFRQNAVNIIRGDIENGFVIHDEKIVITTDKGLFQEKKSIKKKFSSKNTKKISAFTDLEIGNLVVHQSHGIGIYQGIEQLVIDQVKRDYFKIQYRDKGYLYIPTEQLDIIQKYIGQDGKKPKLNKLGSQDWQKTKNKVKESLRELAINLIELYKTRQTIKGVSYSKDTEWQKNFENDFPYDETDDQIQSIEEIKVDMEKQIPMDRILCGDVGYGKTEVAIRAMFKACMDGYQVAYLVPTTVLALQQHQNFVERFKDFPIKVDVLSRLRKKSDQKGILKRMKEGRIDILIGTHRLLSKDLQFNKLGLLVVDEEQRFGVEHKERIKEQYPSVDVLTLTATPIPRTMHMSMVGIRDISVIEMPPKERYPVQTYVMEYDEETIRNAIYRELARGGQIYYIHNRVRDMDIKKAQLQKLVPEANIKIAHGQMSERELERMMIQFENKESDILLCTTIVESGLDIANANTMIVEDADMFGLAQLYQLKGRVGRSNRHAYAYITYRKDKVLSEIASKRLQAIREFTEFGAGFKIALRDLEIRGAGNLLGPEQHGQMNNVGYEMYCRLLEEAVIEARGETVKHAPEEVKIDIKQSAYIDDVYIKDQEQKIDIYKRIAAIEDQESYDDLFDELIDRYGEPPNATVSLMKIAHLKHMASELGFKAVKQQKENVVLTYGNHEDVDLNVIAKLGDQFKRKLMFTPSKEPYLTFDIRNIDNNSVIDNIKILLQANIKLKYGK